MLVLPPLPRFYSLLIMVITWKQKRKKWFPFFLSSIGLSFPSSSPSENSEKNLFSKLAILQKPLFILDFCLFYLFHALILHVTSSEGHCQCWYLKLDELPSVRELSIIEGVQTGVKWHMSVILWSRELNQMDLRSFSALKFYVWLLKTSFASHFKLLKYMVLH